MNERALRLHEELLLLSMRERSGTVSFGGSVTSYGLAGAAVAELLLLERIRVDESRRKRVQVAQGARTGDPLLDECLERMQRRSRPLSLRSWVQKLGALRGLRRRVADGLVKLRVLRAEEVPFLIFFRRTVYREIDPQVRKALIARLREAVVSNSNEVDARTVILLSLANSTGALKRILGAKTVREHRARIRSLVKGELMGQATKEAIEAVQMAVMIATVIPAITVSSSNSN